MSWKCDHLYEAGSKPTPVSFLGRNDGVRDLTMQHLYFLTWETGIKSSFLTGLFEDLGEYRAKCLDERLAQRKVLS